MFAENLTALLGGNAHCVLIYCVCYFSKILKKSYFAFALLSLCFRFAYLLGQFL